MPPPSQIRLRDDDAPPYARVADAVMRAVERGALLPGDRIPTVRGLAEDLGLAPNTVARAYRDLEEQGWLVGRGRAGTYVTARPPLRPPAAERDLARAAERYLRRAQALGFSRETAITALRRA